MLVKQTNGILRQWFWIDMQDIEIKIFNNKYGDKYKASYMKKFDIKWYNLL
jgi:hypothetical protein